jgi:8-oxo-dGTP pyrophosphatase MutT (NUDIX family)
VKIKVKLYPNLFQTQDWGKVTSSFALYDNLPDEQLVSNVNIVPFVNGKCLVIQLDNGNWEMPGGTLEPDEDYRTALVRELIE